MSKRLSSPLLSNSFFIFGARGTGKSTLVKELFSKSKTLVIDLLNAAELEHFLLHPQALAQEAYDFPDAIYRVWSNDHRSLQYGDVKAVHWEKGLAEVF
jgi:hypothetical protein